MRAGRGQLLAFELARLALALLALQGSQSGRRHWSALWQQLQVQHQCVQCLGLAVQSLLPDIQRASERFTQLAAVERQSGSLTGTTSRISRVHES